MPGQAPDPRRLQRLAAAQREPAASGSFRTAAARRQCIMPIARASAADGRWRVDAWCAACWWAVAAAPATSTPADPVRPATAVTATRATRRRRGAANGEDCGGDRTRPFLRRRAGRDPRRPCCSRRRGLASRPAPHLPICVEMASRGPRAGRADCRSAPVGRARRRVAAGAAPARRSAHRRRPHAASDTRWFEMSNDLLVEASLDGWFVRLSGGWEECLGWTRDELMARPFRDFVHPEDRPGHVASCRRARPPARRGLDFENRYRAKDGSYRWLSWRARSDGERKYAVART